MAIIGIDPGTSSSAATRRGRPVIFPGAEGSNPAFLAEYHNAVDFRTNVDLGAGRVL